MPLYEYRCDHCQCRFEVLQSLGAGAQGLVCPECGGTELRKEFSTFAAATSSSTTGAASGAGAGPGCGTGFT